MARVCAFELSRLFPCARIAVELGAWGGLVETDAARDDLGSGVTLRAQRRASHPAKHGELPDVPQRVGEWPLNQFLDRAGPRVGRELAIERREMREEPLDFGGPDGAALWLPNIAAARKRDAPGHKVGEMRDDVNRNSRRVAKLSRCEVRRYIAEDFGCAVRESGDEVTDNRA